jgi:hypothetical protein
MQTFLILLDARRQVAGLGALQITAACEDVNERGPQFPGKAAGARRPVIEPAERGIIQDFRADNVRRDIQQFTNVHERVWPGEIICRNPTVGIQIQFPLQTLCRGPEPAQIAGCLFQHTGRETSLRSRRWRFGWSNTKMPAARVVRCRI